PDWQDLLRAYRAPSDCPRAPDPVGVRLGYVARGRCTKRYTWHDRFNQAWEHERLMAAPAYSWANSFQCPSETTSTVPPTTFMAVSAQIPYDATCMRAALFSGLARELSGIEG